MSNTPRILQQLLEGDRLVGLEAVPRARFNLPVAAAPAAPTRPVPTRAPAMPPRASAAPAATPMVARPAPTPPPRVLANGTGAWQADIEIPLGGAPLQDGGLEVLFISIEWGPPLTGETRALFDRQVAAMKLAPATIGLVRLAWSGAQEPDATALTQAQAQVLPLISRHRPRTAVLFGGFSAKAMAHAASLTLARGRWFTLAADGYACPACATWHPSQLGVDRERRTQTWEDLQKVMAKLAG